MSKWRAKPIKPLPSAAQSNFRAWTCACANAVTSQRLWQIVNTYTLNSVKYTILALRANMLPIVTKVKIFLLLFVLHTQAHPITNNNDAALAQSAVDNTKLLFEVNGGIVQNTPIAKDTATSADSSPDIRIDEAQLAEYTVHSQAEDGGSSSSGGFRVIRCACEQSHHLSTFLILNLPLYRDRSLCCRHKKRPPSQ